MIAQAPVLNPPRQATIPLYVYAVVFSSLCVVWGLLWDIMWHMSIGRDGLFAPPHMLIYVGAVVSGLFSAYRILNLTLNRQHAGRSEAVPFWGVFYGPLGAMFCVWGALAMLASAPFDDWWHNTYGLDVQILTPPHTILAVGIMTGQFGAMVGVLALQNRYRSIDRFINEGSQERETQLKWLFAIAAGLLLTTLTTLFAESIDARNTHESGYYVTLAIVLPFYLLAVGRASLLRWPITTVAALYMLFMVMPSWILQFFPATPRLGPVLNPITTYQPFVFPMLLIVPGYALDRLMQRFDDPQRPTFLSGLKYREWALSALLATAFLLVLLLVQWPFGEFVFTSPAARNHFFLSYSWAYNNSPDWQYRFAYAPWNTEPAADFLLSFGKALLYGTLSARVGLLWGNWMKRIAR